MGPHTNNMGTYTEVQPISIVYSTSRGVMHLQGADALAGSRVMD